MLLHHVTHVSLHPLSHAAAACTPSLTASSERHAKYRRLMQVVVTLVAVAGTAMALANVSGPGAVILGGGLALSSTAVAMQVLQDRGESGSRHGRATFAVLLLQVSLPCFCCVSCCVVHLVAVFIVR